VDNVVIYVCAKFGDNRLRNEKASADGKSITTITRTTLVAIGDPFIPGTKNANEHVTPLQNDLQM